MIKILLNLKKKNKKIISYGAAYKSTTVFNYCNIGNKLIDYVIDFIILSQVPFPTIPILNLIFLDRDMQFFKKKL